MGQKIDLKVMHGLYFMFNLFMLSALRGSKMAQKRFNNIPEVLFCGRISRFGRVEGDFRRLGFHLTMLRKVWWLLQRLEWFGEGRLVRLDLSRFLQVGMWSRTFKNLT